MQLITQDILADLCTQAKENPRLRQHSDLRNSADDCSQRILNAMEPGTVLPIHRHMKSTETVIILKGKLEETFYDENGNVTDCFVLTPGGKTVGINVPIGQWHNSTALESDTVIFEAKDGKYEPLSETDILK